MSHQMPEPPPTAAQAKAETSSLGDLLGDVTRDMSTLMRQEVELAKVELKQSATRAGKGAGMLAGAGVAGHFVLLFLSLALWWALGYVMGLGWSAVVRRRHLGHCRRRPGLHGPQGTQGDQGHAPDRRDAAGNSAHAQTQHLDSARKHDE